MKNEDVVQSERERTSGNLARACDHFRPLRMATVNTLGMNLRNSRHMNISKETVIETPSYCI